MLGGPKTMHPAIPPPLEVREIIQLAAVVIYLLALIACLIT